MLITRSGRRASQNEFELNSFIKFLKDKNVKSYLEIGSRDGDTFHEVMINLPADTLGCAVDLPGGLWGKSSSVTSLTEAVQDLSSRGYQAHMILGDSGDPQIIDLIREFGPFDAILIDGDHTYNAVKRDWNNFKDMGKYVAFHDIVGRGQKEKVKNNEVEVPILWSEIKGQYWEKCHEFVDVGSKMGIGVCELQ